MANKPCMELGRCCLSCSFWRLLADCPHHRRQAPRYRSSSTHWWQKWTQSVRDRTIRCIPTLSVQDFIWQTVRLKPHNYNLLTALKKNKITRLLCNCWVTPIRMFSVNRTTIKGLAEVSSSNRLTTGSGSAVMGLLLRSSVFQQNLSRVYSCDSLWLGLDGAKQKHTIHGGAGWCSITSTENQLN